VLITMDDFKNVVIDIVERKKRRSLRFRDHGHEENIRRSYEMVRPTGDAVLSRDVGYVRGTGELFLKTREALESDRVIVLKASTGDTDLHRTPRM